MLSPNRNTHQHPVVSREAWIEARKAHLKNEKALTRMRDMVSAERRELPWVKVEKEYVFDTPAGKKTLAELFGNNSQLIVYHFMWRWDLGPGLQELLVAGRPCRRRQCPSRQSRRHRSSRSRAASSPTSRPTGSAWAGSSISLRPTDSDFNFDYHVSFTDEQMARARSTTITNGWTRNTVSTSCPASASSTRTTAATSSILIRHTRAAAISCSASTTTSTSRRKAVTRTQIMEWVKRHDEYDASRQRTPSCCQVRRDPLHS